MIKINLSAAQKQLDISNVGGLDLTRLKIAPVFIAFALLYVPDFVLVPMWEEEVNTRQSELQGIQAEVNKLQRKTSQLKVYEKQIKELKAQEDNLSKKLTAVKEAINLKRNPSQLLLYISKNMPQELWIKELSLDQALMVIKGEAMSYSSVGNFVNSLKSSIFIKDASIKSTNSVVREPDKRRVEVFEIHFQIARFEQ
jgi:Tfp pilus assembly protein PilN